ncbi:MAG TPA: hypothetical protein VFB03_03180 [Candidatus Saccharimonadales bacterium]|nr:hypothetical protein [Candidatus Saccharimonadales bacterium]
MRSRGSLWPLMRAAVIFSALGIILTGVTFAALQSPPATLSNNTINSATADLRIGTSNNGNILTTSVAGYSFDGVIPGGSAAPSSGNPVYLRNYGSASMTIKLAVSTTPSVVTVGPSGASVNLSKVYLDITRTDTSTEQKFSIKDLMDANSTGGLALTDSLSGGSVGQYSLRVVMDGDAFTAQSSTISGINIIFTGVGI